MDIDVFISYRHSNVDLVRVIAKGLEDRGWTTWYFTSHSRPGAVITKELVRQIKNAKTFLIVLSWDSLKSPKYLVKEADIAWKNEKPMFPVIHGITESELLENESFDFYFGDIKVIPVTLDNVSDFLGMLDKELQATIGIRHCSMPKSTKDENVHRTSDTSHASASDDHNCGVSSSSNVGSSDNTEEFVSHSGKSSWNATSSPSAPKGQLDFTYSGKSEFASKSPASSGPVPPAIPEPSSHVTSAFAVTSPAPASPRPDGKETLCFLDAFALLLIESDSCISLPEWKVRFRELMSRIAQIRQQITRRSKLRDSIADTEIALLKKLEKHTESFVQDWLASAEGRSGRNLWRIDSLARWKAQRYDQHPFFKAIPQQISRTNPKRT